MISFGNEKDTLVAEVKLLENFPVESRPVLKEIMRTFRIILVIRELDSGRYCSPGKRSRENVVWKMLDNSKELFASTEKNYKKRN